MISPKQESGRLRGNILKTGLCAALSVAPLSPLATQETDDALAVEATAIQAMLAQEGISKARVAISPEFDASRTAPGRRLVANMRPAVRTASLAQRLNARIARLPEVRHCASPVAKCPLSGVDVIVSLSEAEFSGDTARISATAHYNSGVAHAPTAYQTIEFVLVRRAGAWHVISSEHLGVS